MGFFDDPRRTLQDLERELREAEPEAPHWDEEQTDEEDGTNYAPSFRRMAYADETLDDRQVYYEEDYRAAKQTRKQKKRRRGLGGVILLELLGIAAVIGWWIQWLK